VFGSWDEEVSEMLRKSGEKVAGGWRCMPAWYDDSFEKTARKA
jgi:hypothetical protein